MRHSTDQVTINGWNFKLCHHSVFGSAYPFSYQGNSESDILCHCIGPRLHDCARIPLAHPLQSYNRLDIGPHFFPPTVTAGSQDVTICRDSSVVGTSVKSGNSQPGNFSPFSTSKQKEASMSYSHQCFCVFTCLQTRGNSMFPTQNLPSGGYWSCDHFCPSRFEHAPRRLPRLHRHVQ